MGTDKNDTDVWAHKQCKVTFLKIIMLVNKSINLYSKW